MEIKPEFHHFSYITVSGRLYDDSCSVHSVDTKYLKLVSDRFGVFSSGKVQPYSVNVNASPMRLFNLIGSEGYHLVSHSSGRSHLFKTWIFLKEGSPCNCSRHDPPGSPEEGASPPKIRRVDRSRETENDEPIPANNYEEIMEHFKILTANDPLTAGQLFSLLSTAGFQVPFRS